MLPHVVWLDDPTTLTKPGQANSKLGVDRVTPGTSSRAGQDRPSGGRPPGRPLWGGDPMADTPAHLPAREPDDDLDLRSVVQADHAAINDASGGNGSGAEAERTPPAAHTRPRVPRRPLSPRHCRRGHPVSRRAAASGRPRDSAVLSPLHRLGQAPATG